jgi:hypothetical protein
MVLGGGYGAIELFISEMAPLNLALKLGTQHYFLALSVGFDSFFARSLYVGGGGGGIFFLDERYFFNPEITFSFGTNYDVASTDERRIMLALSPRFGFQFFDALSCIIGPSITWVDRLDDVAPKRLFGIGINNNCRLALGIRAGIAAQW